ncbi:HNH endonuclease signature motif containing protein [Microbacterium sp. 69-10]|uniref:HNH endonuclease signature motif containing protein n=1 Tax=Microbacterium sp. 69-10 TaxID=1895783 RepID=UPI0025DFFEEB|nr:HNH endonuclease signature motif containing protein [Microbacterium sp. 69-10]
MLAGAASGWDRVITHPISGELLVVDRYRPSEHLKRHLRARDERCRFPGCGMPVRESDLDHTLDAAYGGPTEDGNLSALCRRHHVLKHHSPWKVKQLGGGLLEWTSPTGRVYFDQPPPRNTVTFVPSDAGSSDRDPSDAWAALAEEFGTPF